MDTKRPLYSLIRELRLEAGYRQEDVAPALRISRSGYSYKEQGKASFFPEELMRLASIFGVNPDVFFSPDLWNLKAADLRKLRFNTPNLSDVGKLSKAEMKIIAEYRRRAAHE